MIGLLTPEELYLGIEKVAEYARTWIVCLGDLYRDHPEVSELSVRDLFGNDLMPPNISDSKIYSLLIMSGVFGHFYPGNLVESARKLNVKMFTDDLDLTMERIRKTRDSRLSDDKKKERMAMQTNQVVDIMIEIANWIKTICVAIGEDYLKYEAAAPTEVEEKCPDEAENLVRQETKYEATHIDYKF